MNKLLIGLITIALLITACGDGGEAGPQKQVNPFISGNAALNMYLQEGLPPPEVYDQNTFPFSVGLVVENVGEHDILADDFFQVRLENLQASLFGVDLAANPDAFVIDRDNALLGQKKNPLDGTTVPGQIDHMIFEDLNYQTTMQGMQAFPFRVKACYDYENNAVALLCFKERTIENAQDVGLCTLNGDKIVYNSAGPIHVTAVRQNSMGSPYVISTTLVFEHVGTGEFFNPNVPTTEDDPCNADVTNPNKYYVDVELNMQGDATIDCTRLEHGNSGSLKFYQGAPQTLTCKITGADEGTPIYQAALDIKMNYRYSEFIEDQFMVRHVPIAN